MRPKTQHKDLPPRMLRRTKKLVSGKIWQAFYYNGRDDTGKRIEIPLGSDLNEAKRKWAELECKPAPVETGLMCVIFDRYERAVIPTKAPRTQRDNEAELKSLRAVFDSAPIDAVTPQHVAQYRDQRTAKVRANREIALLSHVFNMAREWGYTSRENPCKGVRKNREKPRDFYADDAVWQAVYQTSVVELRDAMDLAYLTGQRPADVLKMRLLDIKDGALEVDQGKTGKKLRIIISGQLGQLLERIRSRAHKVRSLYLVATPDGKRMTTSMLRTRFEAARLAASKAATSELAERILKFQFRDNRAKAASEIGDLANASKLLGHSDKHLTNTVYRRVGESVNPTR